MDKRYEGFSILGLIIGFLILAAGIVLLLGNMQVIEKVNILKYWPVILIAIGIGKLFQPGWWYHRVFWGIIITAIGVLFLLNNLQYLHFGFGELWPVLVIIIGFELIRGSIFRHRRTARWSTIYDKDDKDKKNSDPGCCSQSFEANTVDSDFINISTILGGGEYTFTNKNLKGGNVSAIMGGCEIDLRSAEMEGDSMLLETTAIMGGIGVRIPTHWQVVMQGTPILGGMDNKTISPENPAKRLFIRGSAIMGGVEIKN